MVETTTLRSFFTWTGAFGKRRKRLLASGDEAGVQKGRKQKKGSKTKSPPPSPTSSPPGSPTSKDKSPRDPNVPLTPAEAIIAVHKITGILSARGGDIPRKVTKVTDYLYLGNVTNAMDVEGLKRIGVTHVLNMAAGDVNRLPLYHDTVPQNFTYKEVHAHDSLGYDIAQHLEEAHVFIKQARAGGGKVFVHCLAGVNRSGFVVAAHLLLRGCPLMKVASRLKKERGIFLSNTSFQDALVEIALQRNVLL